MVDKEVTEKIKYFITHGPSHLRWLIDYYKEIGDDANVKKYTAMRDVLVDAINKLKEAGDNM